MPHITLQASSLATATYEVSFNMPVFGGWSASLLCIAISSIDEGFQAGVSVPNDGSSVTSGGDVNLYNYGGGGVIDPSVHAGVVGVVGVNVAVLKVSPTSVEFSLNGSPYITIPGETLLGRPDGALRFDVFNVELNSDYTINYVDIRIEELDDWRFWTKFVGAHETP